MSFNIRNLSIFQPSTIIVVNDPDLMRLHGVLRRVLDDDITHLGACHLYIHATESEPATRPRFALCGTPGKRDSETSPSPYRLQPGTGWGLHC